MSYSFLGFLQFIPALLILVAQWIGVMAMRGERTGSWWTMMVGMVISSLGALASILSLFMMFTGSSTVMMLSMVVGFHTFGALVFASGFAMHGLSRRSAREHEKQLEAISTAMAEELRQSRESNR